MKIALLDINSHRKSCVNKDFMGGYGWAFNAGDSFRARMINFVKKAGENLPIMSFGYLAAILRQKGHDVEYAQNSTPSAEVVIMQSSMVDHTSEISWARRLKVMGKTVGFIGPFSSAMPEAFLVDCDFVIRGEPEEAASRIGDVELKGVIESGHIDDLDTIPFPAWEVFPYKRYSYFPALKERPFLPILSSRGCAFRCNYCPYLVNYKWRQRSVPNVLDEIGYLVERFGIRSMLFRDPIFTMDMARSARIAEGILERNYKIKWACETRLDRVDKPLLKLMHSAGLRVINVGVESYHQEIIRRATRKPIEMEHQEEMIRYCDEIGIRVTVFYMFGMPDDTEESLVATTRYAKALNTHVAQFFIFTPFPGTEYYESIKDDIVEKDWERFDCYTPVFRHKNLTAERILALKERAFVTYYYRPSWAAKFVKRAIKDMLQR